MTPVDVGMIFIIIHHIAVSRLFADFPRSIFAQFLQKMQFLHFIAVALFYRIVPALAPELGKKGEICGERACDRMSSRTLINAVEMPGWRAIVPQKACGTRFHTILDASSAL
ncbi:MAG: hypothetical protein SOV63_11395 [Pyramidobacter porci]|uniref:hypothetical protein n=1 Tax=Pyramidobacter porci TaxID=2605789 RepID=UPI002A755D04|nr:hypothetical protein [Pyramidobacter porci]MDY2649396.1 hypothetical protein [Pyramidobacter porci]